MCFHCLHLPVAIQAGPKKWCMAGLRWIKVCAFLLMYERRLHHITGFRLVGGTNNKEARQETRLLLPSRRRDERPWRRAAWIFQIASVQIVIDSAHLSSLSEWILCTVYCTSVMLWLAVEGVLEHLTGE